ncbi:tocopherol cyclase family protein [Skermania piniformis]|uniref:Tocopherol cyclase n=1 Tax=Skermania pinensis TaxID=39122 RepID=A0ABX8SD53_9ACTN|nr:tocopherol cyclase family protein [Skermania piniformis]QXQ14370.1 hypothetical protein KV203_02805 [Skermania piniformis]
MGWVERLRATGADLSGDPLSAHVGVPTEGYLWRFTQPESGSTLLVTATVNRTGADTWGLVTLAAHPEGTVHTATTSAATADPDAFGVTAGAALRARPDRLRVDLGPDAQLDVGITEPVGWPRQSAGAALVEALPGLNRYWHPWLFGGRVTGSVRIGGVTRTLDGAQVYAEKHWGKGRFPDYWWWGQAQGFAEREVCVAFAGGAVPDSAYRRVVTVVVLALPDGQVLRIGDPIISGVRGRADGQRWSFHGRSARTGITLEGTVIGAEPLALPVPLPDRRATVTPAVTDPAARLHVGVRQRSELIWSGESRLAALEYGERTDPPEAPGDPT